MIKYVGGTIDWRRLHVELAGETVGNLLPLANRSYYCFDVRRKRWLYATQSMLLVPFIDLRLSLSLSLLRPARNLCLAIQTVPLLLLLRRLVLFLL